MDLINKIKKKKELSGIPDEIILEVLEKCKFNANPKIKSKKDEKIIIKQVRDELRKYVGRFKISPKSENLIEKNKINEILRLHHSTKERIKFYPRFKLLIKKLNPSLILDIGCGLNPLAIAPGFKYYASDIDENNLKLINLFFKRNKIKGKTFVADIRKERNFPKSDLCLILKVLDIVKMSHKEIESLIKSIKTKTLIISFPTITLSGRPMQKPERYWFERILNKLDYKFKLIKSENELFYLIEQSNSRNRAS